MTSAWSSSWGQSWGDAFGLTAEPAIITGSGSLVQPASVVSGIGSLPGAAALVVPPDAFPGGGVPSTAFVDDAKQRHGLVLAGVGAVEQTASFVNGNARIKRLTLVASGSVSGACGQSSAQAVFHDIEMEIVALLLAA